MACWRCDIRVSWRTRLFSLAVHCSLILLVLLAPWPHGYFWVWFLLVIALAYQGTRSQRKILAHRGEIALADPDRLCWQQTDWRYQRPVWLLSYGALFSLVSLPDSKRKIQRRRLWLAADSMPEAEWRHLRQYLLTEPTPHAKPEDQP